MTIAVLVWQTIIFASIALAGRNRGWVVGFWVVWTAIQVAGFPLSVLQFGTIGMAAALFRQKKTSAGSPVSQLPAAGEKLTVEVSSPSPKSGLAELATSWAERSSAWAQQERLKLKFEEAAQECIKTEGFTCELEERVMKDALARDNALLVEIESDLARDPVLARLYHALIEEGGGLPRLVLQRQLRQRSAIKSAKAHRKTLDNLMDEGDDFRAVFFKVSKSMASVGTSTTRTADDSDLQLLGRHWNEWLADVEAQRARTRRPRASGAEETLVNEPLLASVMEVPPVVNTCQHPQRETPGAAYVTRYTFTRLGKQFLRPDAVPIDAIYDYIFEISLAEVLNHEEASRLYVQKRMLEGKARELAFAKRVVPNAYVFSVGSPKFHASRDCEFLHSDFYNYLVPAEIKALGDEHVIEFQRFCEDNKRILREKSADVFWAHVSAHFKTRIQPQPVRFDNSGVNTGDAETIDAVKARVEELLARAHAMLEKDDGLLKRLRYAGNWKRVLTQLDDEGARKLVSEFFELKQELLAQLFDFYRKSCGAEDLVIPVDLLKLAGLSPCKGCWPADEASSTHQRMDQVQPI